MSTLHEAWEQLNQEVKSLSKKADRIEDKIEDLKTNYMQQIKNLLERLERIIEKIQTRGVLKGTKVSATGEISTHYMLPTQKPSYNEKQNTLIKHGKQLWEDLE